MAAPLIFTNEFGGTCLLCGTAPMTEEEQPQMKPMATVPGMDVNWGESVLICTDCIGVMADFIGRPKAELYAKAVQAARDNKQKVADLSGELAEANSKIERMLDGKKAVREAREAQEAQTA